MTRFSLVDFEGK